MIAVILAAGMAKRLRPLTDNTPKCLLDVKGRSLLERSMDAILASGVRDFVIVTGYLNHMIEDFVKSQIKVYAERQNVHIVNNEGLNIDNVRIFDAYGRLVYNNAVKTTHEVIGLNVATGTYIVNVTTDKGTANYKVVIVK